MTIEVNGISKTYTGKKAVDNVSFTAEAGKALGILGRNGAGKTTTIRILMNVIRPGKRQRNAGREADQL